MKAAIAIDNWKLPIFKRRLTDAGFQYEENPGVTSDTLLLTVQTDDAAKLETVVRAANTEAARVKGPEARA